jgi:transcriptional regulator with XRE-family HTH domain
MVSVMDKTPKDAKSPRVTRPAAPVRQNGPAIAVIRELRGLSQNRLAKDVGIAQPSLSQIEAETVSARVVTLNQIASKLRIDVRAIMRGQAAAGDGEEAPGVPEEAAA